MKWYWWVVSGIVILGIGGGIWYLLADKYTQSSGQTAPTASSQSVSSGSPTGSAVSPSQATSSTTAPSADAVTWQFDESGWKAIGPPPPCPDPLVLATPVDLALATAILYPGQSRGGNYKPHGGFRFDNSSDNAIVVTAPMDARVVNGARYLVHGETQYTFDFIADCGIMYRLGHLLELAPRFQAIADTFPVAKENDSRTTILESPVLISKGEEIATAVGVRADTNTFVDWGVYDLRTKNRAAADATWAAQHTDDTQLAPYAVCWLDLLSTEDKARVRSLTPGDPTSGTTSDYCK